MMILVLLWSVLFQPPPQAAPMPIRIQGATLDAATGKPLSGVRVWIGPIYGESNALGGVPPIVRQAIRSDSGSDGAFVLEPPEPGPHTIYASKTGYENWKISLSAEEVRRRVEVVFKLVPLPLSGAVSGRAVDAAGRPLAGTKVELLGYSRMSQISLGSYTDRPELSGAATRNTDDRGEFRLFDVKPGQYFLRVASPGKPSDELSPLHPAFYPGVMGLTRAEKLEIRPGEEVRLGDIVLAPSPLKPILVRTTDATGDNPLSAGSVSLFGGPAPDNPPSTTGLVGGVSAIRPDEPGNYTVCTSRPYLVEGPPRFVHGQKACSDIVYTGDSLDITLTIQKAVASLTGRVLLEDLDGSPPVPLARVSIGGVGIGPGSNYGGTSDGNGLFRSLTAIPDGPVTLRFITAPEGHYIASILQDSRDALEKGVLVAGEDTNLDVRVRKGVGSITGTVTGRDGKPPDHAAVVLIPEGQLRQRPDKDNTHRIVTTNLNGTFEITNIIPGRYRVYAMSQLEDGAHLDAEVFKPFEEQSAPVEIFKGARASLDLRQISPRE